MAESVLRHVNDEGYVSVFIDDTSILFVCDKKHWWIVEASHVGPAEPADASQIGPADVLPGPPTGAARASRSSETTRRGAMASAGGRSLYGQKAQLAYLKGKFGSEPLKHMGVTVSGSARRSTRGALNSTKARAAGTP